MSNIWIDDQGKRYTEEEARAENRRRGLVMESDMRLVKNPQFPGVRGGWVRETDEPAPEAPFGGPPFEGTEGKALADAARFSSYYDKKPEPDDREEKLRQIGEAFGSSNLGRVVRATASEAQGGPVRRSAIEQNNPYQVDPISGDIGKSQPAPVTADFLRRYAVDNSLIADERQTDSLRDAVHYFLQIFHAGAAATGVRVEKLAGIARPDVMARDWEDVAGWKGIGGYYNDVQTQKYRYHDLRSADPIGRVFYAMDKSGAMGLIKAALPELGPSGRALPEEVVASVLKAIPSGAILNLAASEQAGQWYKDPAYQAAVNMPLELMMDLANPVNEIVGVAVHGAAALKNNMFWNQAGRRLLAAGEGSVEGITRFLIKEVEGAPVVNDSLIASLKEALDAGDTQLFAQFGMVSGGTGKSYFSQGLDKIAYLSHMKRAGSTHSPMMEDVFYKQLGVQRFVEQAMGDALMANAPLRATLEKMDHSELSAFVLASGSADSLRDFTTKSYVQGLGHVDSPLVRDAVEQMTKSVGFDSAARTRYWPEIKVRLIQETQEEIDANIARYGVGRGEMAAVEQSLIGATPEETLKLVEQRRLLAGEGSAIKRKIEELLVRRDEFQAQDAPRLMGLYSARLKDLRHADDASDPIMQLYREYAVPSYNNRRTTGKEIQEILDGYGQDTKQLREHLIKMYDGVTARAARETGEARYSRVLSGIEDSIATVDKLALSEAPGSQGAFLLAEQRRSLEAVRAEALARVERHVRPAHGQRTAGEQITGQPGQWFGYQRKLASARRELGRASEVHRKARAEYAELSAVSENLKDGTAMEAARAQLEKADARVTLGFSNLEAVTGRIDALKKETGPLWELRKARTSEAGKLSRAAADEAQAFKKQAQGAEEALEQRRLGDKKLTDDAYATADVEAKALSDESSALWASVPADKRAANRALWDKRIAATAKTEEKLEAAELDVKGGLQEAEFFRGRKREYYQDQIVTEAHLRDAIQSGDRAKAGEMRDRLVWLRAETKELDENLFAVGRVLDHVSVVQRDLRTKLKLGREKAIAAFEAGADKEAKSLSEFLEQAKNSNDARRAAVRSKPSLLVEKLRAEQRALRKDLNDFREKAFFKTRKSYEEARLLRESPDLDRVIREKQDLIDGMEKHTKVARAAVVVAQAAQKALKTEIKALGSGLALARKNSSAAFLRMRGAQEAEKAASERAKLLLAPTPNTVMKMADDALSVWDGGTNILKRTVLFTPYGRFAVKNTDNVIKAYVEVGPNHVYRGVNELGERYLITPRQSFAGDAVRADPRATPGLIERVVSDAQEKFPLPTKLQQQIIHAEEKYPRELIYDKYYWEKADELKATGIMDPGARHSLANAYAEKKVDEVQFLGRPLGIIGRSAERVAPFSATYGWPAFKYAIKGIFRRPAYTHAVINLQEALEDPRITPDGKIEIADGHRIDPTFFVGLANTMSFLDRVRLTDSFPFVEAKPRTEDFEPGAARGTVVTDPEEDRTQLSARAGALMSMRGTVVRPHPVLALGEDLVSEPDKKGKAVEKFVRGTFGMPVDLALKVAAPLNTGLPTSIGEAFFQGRQLVDGNPENMDLYFKRQRDEILTEFQRRKDPITPGQADGILRFRTAMQGWGYIAGSDGKFQTQEGAQLDAAKRQWFELPASARSFIYESGAIPEAKLWGKYTKEEREAKLDKMGDEKDPKKVMEMYKGANPAEQKTLLRTYYDKIMNAAPTSDKDGVDIRAKDLVEALAGSKMGTIARELFAPESASAAEPEARTRIADFQRIPTTPTEKNEFARRALALTGDRAVEEFYLDTTKPADREAARATFRAVLEKSRRPGGPAIIVGPSMTTEGGTGTGVPVAPLYGPPGGILGEPSAYTLPSGTDAATTLALQLAEFNFQSRFSGLKIKFNDVLQAGTKADAEALVTDVRYQEFFDLEGRNSGARILDEKSRLAKTSAIEQDLNNFIKFRTLPYGAEKRMGEQRRMQFPGNDYWIDQLRSSAYNNPKTTADVVHAAMASMTDPTASAQYKASPDLFRILQVSEPAMYDRIAAAASYDDIVRTVNRVTRHDPLTGRAVALDIPALRYEMKNGNSTGLAAIRAGLAGKDMQAFLERAIASEPLPNSALGKNIAFNLNEIPIDPSAMGEYFRTLLKIMTGETTYELASSLRATMALPAPLAPEGQVALISRVASTPLPQGSLFGDVGYGVKLTAPMQVGEMVRQQDIAPPLPIRTQPHGSVGNFVSSTVREYGAATQAWKDGGSVGQSPSFMSIAASNFFYTPKTGVDSNGRDVVGPPQMSMNATQQLGAISTLGSVAGALGAYEPGSDVASGFSGFSTGIATAGALMTLGVVTGGVGLIIGAGVGIAAGLVSSRKRGNNSYSEENMRLRREELALQKARFDEQLKQQDIRDIRTREGDLAKAIGGMTPGQRQQVAPQLAAFQRRPTFQSRIGLVDAVERAVGSAIKPRW